MSSEPKPLRSLFDLIDPKRKPPPDPNAHLPPTRRHVRPRRRPIGERAFGKTEESRANQLANLCSGRKATSVVSRQAAIRRRNHRTAGGRFALSAKGLAVRNFCHLCEMRCDVLVGQPRTQSCFEHAMQRGALVCPYYVSGLCGYRPAAGPTSSVGSACGVESSARDCFLEDGAAPAEDDDMFTVLHEARLEAARTAAFKSNRYSLGRMRRARGRYTELLRQVRSSLCDARACRYTVEIGRLWKRLDPHGIDPEVYWATVRGELPRRGSEAARRMDVFGDAMQMWVDGGCRSNLTAIVDALVADRFPRPVITEPIKPWPDGRRGMSTREWLYGPATPGEAIGAPDSTGPGKARSPGSDSASGASAPAGPR